MTGSLVAATATGSRPLGTTLPRLYDLAVERNGDRSDVVFEGRRWPMGELAARSRRLAGGLAEAGLSPGDRVVVCMANCPEVGVTYHAVWRAGAAVTPVLFLLSADELHHVLADSAAAFVVTTPEFLALVRRAAAGVATVRAIVVAGERGGDPGSGDAPPILPFSDVESGPDRPVADRAADDMAALLYTGGTTGRAKGVMLSHDALSAAAWAAIARAEVPAGGFRTALLPLPLSHVYGLMASIVSLHSREPGRAVLMRWFDARGWLRLVAEHRVAGSALVPSMLQMLLAEPLEEYDLSSLQRLVCGGASLSPEVTRQFLARVGQVEISEGYGCTESSAVIASTGFARGRPGSVGQPSPDVEVRIELPDGDEAGVGQDGEICVRGPMVMTGYWKAPEETAYALRGGWLHTGDVGRLDADGYLYVVDRLKDLVIRGGFNVYPRDVEDVLLGHPDVSGCAVVGRPDPRYGEEVVAFVQGRPGATVTPEELVSYAKAHLSAAKYPREVHLIDAIPMTSVGKVDRKALRRRFAS